MSIVIDQPELFRENVRKALGKFFEEEKWCHNIEKGVFNYAIKEADIRKITKKWTKPEFCQLYKDRLRSVYINLKNPTFLELVKSGEIQPEQLAFITHQEMNPERWKPLIENKIKRDQSKYNNNIEASTDVFTCRKCKSNRCVYTAVQVRSSDEPTTLFVSCLNCGKNWKEN
jgi:DNA-directed RNA polymerase subunit M/transcription elongation factor TFIIS